MCFFNAVEWAFLEQNEPLTTLITMMCRKYYFQKLTCISKEKSVLDTPASNTYSFVSRDTCVSSIS
jgi:hypothetical protein